MAADEKTLKPKSFRIDDATAEKFKGISAEIGGNQQETLAKLIEAYEFQAGKAILTEKKADIEQFEKYVTALTRMFMGSLEDNQNITETVRTEFDAMLKSKDSTIQDLQEQLSVAKQLKADATEKAKTFSDENVDLKKQIEELQNELESRVTSLNAMLSDKEKLNQALTNSYDELKQKADSMQKEHEDFAALRAELENKQSEIKSLTKDKEDAETYAEKMKQQEKESVERCREQMQIAQEKALLEADRKYQDQIQKLKEEKQTEIDKYQKKYFDLLEKIQREHDN